MIRKLTDKEHAAFTQIERVFEVRLPNPAWTMEDFGIEVLRLLVFVQDRDNLHQLGDLMCFHLCHGSVFCDDLCERFCWAHRWSLSRLKPDGTKFYETEKINARRLHDLLERVTTEHLEAIVAWLSCMQDRELWLDDGFELPPVIDWLEERMRTMRRAP